MSIAIACMCMLCRATPCPLVPQGLVRGRRAIAADHLDLGVGPPEGSQQVAEQIQKARVVRVDVVLAPVAQDSIDPGQRGGIVAIRVPVHDVETLPGVEMVEAQAVRPSRRGPHARDGGSRRDEHADEANEGQETPRCVRSREGRRELVSTPID